MSTSQIGAVIGIVLAVVWALTGFWWVLLAIVLAAIGWMAGSVVDGRVDLARFLGHDHDRDDVATSRHDDRTRG